MVKKLEEYAWLCPQPFINLHKNLHGSVKPCCVTQHHNIYWPSVSIDEYFKGEQLKNLRKEILTTPGDLVARNCEICLEQEKHSEESHRRTYLSYLEHTKPEIKLELEEYLETDMEKPFIKTMEWIAPNNFCNLRCFMCAPSNSSSIAKENIALGIGIPNYSSKGDKLPWKFPDKAAKDILEFEDKVLENLVEIKLTGGETLAIEYNYNLLDTIVNNFNSEEMDLRITTNGTLTPKFNGKDIFDYIPMFKSTLLNISIEGWEERNGYIRYPSKWSTIMKNVRRFAEMDKIKILFVSCVSSLSVGYLWEIAREYESLLEEYPDIFYPFVTGSLVWGEWNKFTVSAVPLELREQYIQNYYENPNMRYVKDYLKLISFLENVPFDVEKHRGMMLDIRARDKHRGTNLLDLWPEWEPYYK